MSPIVRRDDDGFRSSHRKKVTAINRVLDEQDQDTPWNQKDTKTHDPLDQLKSSPSYPDDSDPDIFLPTSTTRPDGSSSFEREREHLSSNGSRKVGIRYSVGSNATYPPVSSDSLVDVLADLTTTIPHSRTHVVKSAISLLIQSTPSLIVSLIGLIFTGQLLDHLAVWNVFLKCDELFIAVPALQNLKGNLEMCLGAKLGTAVSSYETQKIAVAAHH